MYQITCDEYILHDPRLSDLSVIEAKCDLAINKTGSLSFLIAPTHPYYDVIKKHKSIITLYQDEKILFRGRVLNDEIDFYNMKSVECEGELSYLIDSIQVGREYHLDGGSQNVIETYLKSIINIHNEQVDDFKKFTVGIVNITDPNNYLYKISNYEDTLTTIFDKLVGTYGGYIQIRHVDDIRYIDYISNATNSCNQTIEFGKNIIDMSQSIKGEDIYTALIPLGATLDSENVTTGDSYERRLKISDLPNSTDGTLIKLNDYVYDSEAVKKWGWIWKVEKWDDVSTKEALLSKAKKQLKNSINTSFSVEMTAIDLHLLNVDIDRINVCDKVHCISKPHGIDMILMVNEIHIDLDNPANTTIKLSTIDAEILDKTLTSGNKDNSKNIVNVKDELNESYTNLEDFNTGLNDIKDWVNDTYDTGIKDWINTNYDTGIKDWINNNYDSGIKDWVNSDYDNGIKDWVNNHFLPQGADGSVDLSGYAKIDDVNTAFEELATALGGL